MRINLCCALVATLAMCFVIACAFSYHEGVVTASTKLFALELLGSSCLGHKTERQGDMAGQRRSSEAGVAGCASRCRNTSRCEYWTYLEDGECHLHNVQTGFEVRANSRATTGPRLCPLEPLTEWTLKRDRKVEKQLPSMAVRWRPAIVGQVTDKGHPPQLAESCAVDRDEQYVPSEYEMEWTKKTQAGKICAKAWEQRYDAMLWVNYSKNIWKQQRMAPRPPDGAADSVLSKFVPRWGGEATYIEPLSGMARHPLAFRDVKCNNPSPSSSEQHFDADKYDVSYLIVQSSCGRVGPAPRARFFDLGCTVFSEKKAHGRLPTDYFDYSGGSASGPSIPLFYNLYRDRCVIFDDIYAFEGQQYQADGWWRAVPDSIRDKIHFYNHNVMESPFAESVRGNETYQQGGSFLNMLRRAARPEDFVVVKLDIDGGPELEIAYALCDQPDLFTRVDEFYFEYHFDFDGLDFGWHRQNPLHKVDHAIALMRCLRERGIRSHFWI